MEYFSFGTAIGAAEQAAFAILAARAGDSKKSPIRTRSNRRSQLLGVVDRTKIPEIWRDSVDVRDRWHGLKCGSGIAESTKLAIGHCKKRKGTVWFEGNCTYIGRRPQNSFKWWPFHAVNNNKAGIRTILGHIRDMQPVRAHCQVVYGPKPGPLISVHDHMGAAAERATEGSVFAIAAAQDGLP